MAVTKVGAWVNVSGTLKRRGSADRALASVGPFAYRESLTYGNYQPSANTCGLLGDPNRPLTVQTGDLTVNTAGAAIRDLEIRGQLFIKAANVTVDNCWIRGGATARTASTGLVLVTDPSLNAIVRDCLIEPQTPDTVTDGFQYSGFTALRCRVRSTVDGFGVFSKTGGTTNVAIKGCWVESLSKFYPDAAHTNGTHNDCVQLQGGSGATIVGNRFDGILSTSTGNTGGYDTDSTGALKSPLCPQTNACVQLNSNTGPLDSVTITDNWMYGGILGINGLNTSFQTASNLTNLVIKRNRFDHNQYVSVSSEGRIGIQPQPVIVCPTSGIDANVYMDTGAPVELHRGS